jgi:membrane fusion protein (multidrug efflux system)
MLKRLKGLRILLTGGSRQRVMAVVMGMFAIAGGAALFSRWGIEETDNAQIESHLVEISSRVAGTVDRVAVQDNQVVQHGALLLSLDARDINAQLNRAEADLLEARRAAAALGLQAKASLNGAEASADIAAADALVAKAELERTSAELKRMQLLVNQGGVSRQELDRSRAAYHQARAQLTRSQASAMQAQASRSQVLVEQEKAAAAKARIQQAEASLAEARLKLGHMRIMAPGDGRIGSLTAEPGRQVQPGQPLMSLVDPHPWVEANFKETQLEALRTGQAAEISVDAFLLPPDNASGNFTKVVQRVTARISLDEVPPAMVKRLVPGLSASVRVHR